MLSIPPKYNLISAENEIITPPNFQDTPLQTVGGFSVTPSEITQGKIKIQGLMERILIGEATLPMTGIGIFMGNDGATTKGFDFRVGDPATNYLHWDASGSILKISVTNADAIVVEHGSDILLKHGGDVKFTSVTAPTACTATLVATDVGNVDAGAHIYKVTYVNETGGTELGTASNTVTTDATHKQVNLTAIPVSTSGSVTSRKIYRTKAGGSDYYLLTTIANNTATTYTDNTADADLTGGLANYLDNTTFGKIIVDGVVRFVPGFRNTFIGKYSGKSVVTAYDNVAVGANTLYSNTIGYGNVALGYAVLHFSTGNFNTGIGHGTLYNITSGNSNLGVGQSCLSTNTTGSYNLAIGNNSLYNTNGANYNTGVGHFTLKDNISGASNIALGYYAGKYETGSDAFYINNQDRTNLAGDKAKSILYGVMAAAVANQRLTVNAILKNSVQAGITAYAGGGQASAVAITANIAEISVCATAADSVKLPLAETGMKIIITNHGAASCDVFPNTDDAINKAAVNTAKALAVNASMMCVAYNNTDWECLTLSR